MTALNWKEVCEPDGGFLFSESNEQETLSEETTTTNINYSKRTTLKRWNTTKKTGFFGTITEKVMNPIEAARNKMKSKFRVIKASLSDFLSDEEIGEEVSNGDIDQISQEQDENDGHNSFVNHGVDGEMDQAFYKQEQDENNVQNGYLSQEVDGEIDHIFHKQERDRYLGQEVDGEMDQEQDKSDGQVDFLYQKEESQEINSVMEQISHNKDCNEIDGNLHYQEEKPGDKIEPFCQDESDSDDDISELFFSDDVKTCNTFACQDTAFFSSYAQEPELFCQDESESDDDDIPERFSSNDIKFSQEPILCSAEPSIKKTVHTKRKKFWGKRKKNSHPLLLSTCKERSHNVETSKPSEHLQREQTMFLDPSVSNQTDLPHSYPDIVLYQDIDQGTAPYPNEKLSDIANKKFECIGDVNFTGIKDDHNFPLIPFLTESLEETNPISDNNPLHLAPEESTLSLCSPQLFFGYNPININNVVTTRAPLPSNYLGDNYEWMTIPVSNWEPLFCCNCVPPNS